MEESHLPRDTKCKAGTEVSGGVDWRIVEKKLEWLKFTKRESC
jgi:hypothetical protein